MLFPLTLWTVVLLLVWAVVRGPERWHRSVTLNVRPDAAEPTHSGFALLFWRNLLLLVLVGLWAVAVTRAALGPGTEELYETTEVAVGLVPDDELDADRLAAELRVLVGHRVGVDELGLDVPDDDDGGGGTRDVTYLLVRSLGALERREDTPDAEGRDPAACVVIDSTTYPGTEVDETILVSVAEGACSAVG